MSQATKILDKIIIREAQFKKRKERFRQIDR